VFHGLSNHIIVNDLILLVQHNPLFTDPDHIQNVFQKVCQPHNFLTDISGKLSALGIGCPQADFPPRKWL